MRNPFRNFKNPFKKTTESLPVAKEKTPKVVKEHKPKVTVIDWFTSPRVWIIECEKRRVARLINNQGLKIWTLGKYNILALNEKNAKRKYTNLINNESR